MCSRRLGLWQYRSTTVAAAAADDALDAGSSDASTYLDVVTSHRDYCPIRTITGQNGKGDRPAPWWTESTLLREDEGWREAFESAGSRNDLDGLRASVKASLDRIGVDRS
jgi:hypothetical protein